MRFFKIGQDLFAEGYLEPLTDLAGLAENYSEGSLAAWGLPMAIFVLTTFIQELPRKLIEVAEIDGASRLSIYHHVILPLIRPALGTVAVINLINIWNDIWFPFIFSLQESHRTLMLGVAYFFGTDWTKVLVVLTLAAFPVIILYILMSKQFIKGLTAGAIKG